jgi:hypothetical protein
MPRCYIQKTHHLPLLVPWYDYAGLQSRQQGLRIRQRLAKHRVQRARRIAANIAKLPELLR